MTSRVKIKHQFQLWSERLFCESCHALRSYSIKNKIKIIVLKALIKLLLIEFCLLMSED